MGHVSKRMVKQNCVEIFNQKFRKLFKVAKGNKSNFIKSIISKIQVPSKSTNDEQVIGEKNGMHIQIQSKDGQVNK